MIEMNGSLNSARFCYIAKYASSSLQYWGLTVGIDELTGRNRNGEDQEGKRVRFWSPTDGTKRCRKYIPISKNSTVAR